VKIAVNTRLVIPDKMDGIGWFTLQTFKILAEQNPNISFYFIFDRTPPDFFKEYKNVTPIVISPKTRHIYLFPYWYQVALKRVLNNINPDVFVATDGMFPLNSNIKTLAVIHDLNFEHYPKMLPKNVLKYYQKYFPQFAKKATRIATVSEYSKSDIINTYQINSEKIKVVYNGASSSFKPLNKEVINQVRIQYTKGKPYFLFVGTIHPRKNIVNLLKAFEQFKHQYNSDFKIVIAGKMMWKDKELDELLKIATYSDDVVFTGRLSDEELTKVTAAATALTYLPFFEGFGIPIVEAMRCGVPVIASNVTSMPEVAGKAALLVNPTNVDEITKAMHQVTTNESLKNELLEEAKKQVQQFTWENTAKRMMLAIEEVCSF